MLIGGVIGGVLSSIPIISLLNCCFCLPNMAGVAIGLSMFLKSHPQDNLSAGEAAGGGAMAGAVAGLIAGILGLIMNMIVGGMMAGFYRSMPPQFARAMAQATAGGVMAIPLNLFLYGAMGALGGFLAMQLFFKDRLAK